MYVTNTHLKPVIGIDIHFVNTPVPFIPLPHPYIGLVIDPFDYLPFIGATVKVNHVPRGNTDTSGMIITFSHIPFGVGFSMMPVIGHDSQNFFGSKTVSVDGAPMSGAGYMLMTCNDIGIPLSFRPRKKFKPIPSLYLPTSYCIPLQWGKPVIVGGPLVPNFSLMALLKAFAFGSFLKIFGKIGGKLLKALNNKVLKKLPGTQKLTSKLCKMGFEPVDLITGRVTYEYTDFELPGPIPIKWTRAWDSDSAIKGPLGHGVQLAYDRCVRLWPNEEAISVTLADGRQAVFPLLCHGESFYHPQEKMHLRRKQNGHFILEDHNESLYYHFNHDVEPGIWRLSFIENYSGNRVQLHYTGGNLSAITDSAGRQLLCKLDKQHRITEVKVKHRGQEQLLVTYDYNDAGDLIRIADALQQAVEIEYRYHLMIKKCDRNGQCFYWEYDSKKRCIHTWGDGGVLEGFIQYRKGHNIVTNSLGETSTWYFDENNLCVQETDHYGNNRYIEYTEDFEIYRQIDEEGKICGYVYDEQSRLKVKIFPDGASQQFHYNEYSQLTLVINADGSSQTYGYDNQRRLRFINYPNGKTVSYEYNAEGQLTSVTETGNRKTIIKYDDDENPAVMHLPDGTTAYWQYDAFGRWIRSVNTAEEVRFFEYDQLSRLTAMHLPDGNTVHLEYNGYDEVTRATDKHNDVQFEYTVTGNVKKRTRNNTEQRFIYDTEERLRTVVNEQGRHYSFDYNKRGEIIKETGFDGLQRQYNRDSTGKIIKTLRAEGRYAQYEYDASGRIIRVEHHDGTWEQYGYDKNGNLNEAINEYCAVKLTRNKMGAVETEQQDAYTVQSVYDKLGNRIAIKSNLGAHIQIRRNQVGQATQVQAASWAANIKYNGAGQEIERLLPGGVISERKYDEAGRPGEHIVKRGGAVQSWKKYAWDTNNRVTGIFDALAQSNTMFKHDTLGNLVFAQYADNSIVHRATDSTGNLYETKEKADSKYNSGGALLENNKYIFKYDGDGNLISKTVKATQKKHQYEWYANGMLKKVIRPNGSEVTLTYDALGRRISKCYDGKLTRWVWDANVPLHEWCYAENEKPVVEVNEWGALECNKQEPVENIVTWVFDADKFAPAAKIVNGTTYSIITDYLGTPVEAYDENGKRVWECVLDIYGRRRSIIGEPNFVPFRYQGQYEDAETGLYYNRHRFYDAETGRYISQDPIALQGGDNLYAYVHDPNLQIDIFGMHEAIAWLNGDPVLTPNGKYSWYSTPGSSKAPFNGYGAAGHSEAKLLEHLEKTQVGNLKGSNLRIVSMGQMTKRGVNNLSPLPPCPRCYEGLEAFAKKHEMNIEYVWDTNHPDGKKIFKGCK